MTEEEYFRKNYPNSCYGDKPLSPYWDFFQDGVEFGERQSEKKIAELEKENTELKEKLEHRNCLDCSNHSSKLRMRTLELEKENAELKEKNKWYSEQVCYKECAEEWGKLTKAKEIIKELLNSCFGYNSKTINYEVKAKAEQFLKEVSE